MIHAVKIRVNCFYIIYVSSVIVIVSSIIKYVYHPFAYYILNLEKCFNDVATISKGKGKHMVSTIARGERGVNSSIGLCIIVPEL